MRKSFLIATTFFVISGHSIYAQDSLRNSLALVPQYLFVQGFRLDYERKLLNPKNTIIVVSYFYKGITSDSNILGEFRDDHLTGYGLELHFNHIIINDFNGRADYYVSAGTGFKHYKITYDGFGWEPYIENGLQLLRQVEVEQYLKINRFELIFLMGDKHYFNERIFIDMYLGVAILFPSFNESQKNGRDYRSRFIDYGSEGVSLRLGLKIGAVLN